MQVSIHKLVEEYHDAFHQDEKTQHYVVLALPSKRQSSIQLLAAHTFMCIGFRLRDVMCVCVRMWGVLKNSHANITRTVNSTNVKSNWNKMQTWMIFARTAVAVELIRIGAANQAMPYNGNTGQDTTGATRLSHVSPEITAAKRILHSIDPLYS